MRLFQNSGMFPEYYKQRRQDSKLSPNFKSQIASFLDSRYGAAQFLAPVLRGDETAFFTNGDDEVLQRAWAQEAGMPAKAALADILLAQIEAHRTEVFYNLHPCLLIVWSILLCFHTEGWAATALDHRFGYSIAPSFGNNFPFPAS